MVKAKDIPAEILRQHFEIRDGELWRRAYTDASGRKRREKKVEPKDNNGDGYCQVQFKERKLLYHRILWILANGDIPNGLQIDHINGNRLDNRLGNLHLVSNRENHQNRAFHRATGRLGYYWDKQANKWHARIRSNGKRIHLGYFTDENEAQQAYNIACEILEAFEDPEKFGELVKSWL